MYTQGGWRWNQHTQFNHPTAESWDLLGAVHQQLQPGQGAAPWITAKAIQLRRGPCSHCSSSVHSHKRDKAGRRGGRREGGTIVSPTPHTSPGQETEAVVAEDSGREAMQRVHGWTHLLRVLSLWPLRCLLQLCKEARQMPCLQATHWPRPVCVYKMMWLRIGRGVLYTVDQSYVAALHLFSSQTEKQIQYFHDTCSIITVTQLQRETWKENIILLTSDPSVYVMRKCVSDEGDVQLLIVSRGHLSESFLW